MQNAVSYIQILFGHKTKCTTNNAKTWINLENTILHERRHAKNTHIVWFLLHQLSIIGDSMQKENMVVVARIGTEFPVGVMKCSDN